MKKHPYIRLIEYAIARNGQFCVADACEACELTEKRFWFISDSAFILNANQGKPERVRADDRSQEWVLSPNAYFGYLQFEASRYARRAVQIGIVGVLIACAVGGVSIFASLQHKTPTTCYRALQEGGRVFDACSGKIYMLSPSGGWNIYDPVNNPLGLRQSAAAPPPQ